MKRKLLWLGLTLALTLSLAQAQTLEDQVHEFTLENGLKVIMVVDDTAPVINFSLMFDVGGIDEPEGLGGVAHMVEHMAFKGTRSVGSLDIEEELEVLGELEVAAIALEMAEEGGASGAELEAFQRQFEEARAEAQALGADNPLTNFLTANGGVGLNASTGYDRTNYTVSLPANRLELYARLYADVLANPVFRSFYEERDVVREERRQRSEDSPDGMLYEAFLQEAFQVHPYGRPLIGAPEEIESYRADEARAFYNVYYQPNRAVLVMVGDLEPEEDIEIIRRYFGFVPAGPDVETVIPEEPEQTEERRVTVPFDAEPQVLVGYHKPTLPDRDAYVLDVMDYILGKGRTSRLFRRMVTGDELALSVSTSSASPGIRDPNLFVFEGQPRAPHTTEELEAALYDELDRLKNEPVGEEELEKAKNNLRADVLRSLASGSALAQNLAFNELFAGGWESLTEDLDRYDTVTPEEIMTVAARYFTPENRTVATLEPLTETMDENTGGTTGGDAGQTGGSGDE